MFKTLSAKVAKDRDYPDADKIHAAQCRRAVLNGSIYAMQQYEFHEEKNSAKEYVLLRDRAPSVRYNLCRIVVLDSAALLFSEGMFPALDHKDPDAVIAVSKLAADSNLAEVMTDAVIRGSVGSVAIFMRILNGRVFWSVYDTDYLTPSYDPKEPDTLIGVTEKYKLKGDALKAAGYPIEDSDLAADFWFQRVWDQNSEQWFQPWKASDKDAGPVADTGRSVTHSLGFCPWVWIKNLPGGTGDDGACTFLSAIDNQIEIEYQLSQAGRGLKYSSDPTLLIKEPAGTDNELVRSASTAIVVDKDGDAKMLEITGSAADTVVEFCKSLREMALESIGGSRANADKVTAPQSGRAQELMYQPLVWLADKLRSSYGQNGLLDMLRMLVKASEKIELRTRDEQIGKLPGGPIALKWPDWFPMTNADKLSLSTTLQNLLLRGVISRETATTIVAPIFNIADAPAEALKVIADMAADDARLKAQAAVVTAQESTT